jgi:2-oxoisovalerate dehydrogenase E1 component
METTYFPQAHDIIDVVTGEFFPSKRTNKRGVRSWDDLDLARQAL